jgi:hypothetical protein
LVFPEDAGIGATPARRANERGLRAKAIGIVTDGGDQGGSSVGTETKHGPGGGRNSSSEISNLGVQAPGLELEVMRALSNGPQAGLGSLVRVVEVNSSWTKPAACRDETRARQHAQLPV